MKRMNKQVYVAVLMALTTMSINSYAVDVTMNNNTGIDFCYYPRGYTK